MRITADRTRCQGMREAALPHILQVDAAGKVRVLTDPVSTPDHFDTQLAIDTCPVESLRAEL